MTYKDISPLGIIVGLCAIQAVSMTVSTGLIILFFFMYDNSVMVAVFEYPLPIAMTMLLTLLSTSLGGYCSLLFTKKSLINPFLVGLISLVLNVWLLSLIDFKYAIDYRWLLVITSLLIIPSSLFGGYLYQHKST